MVHELRTWGAASPHPGRAQPGETVSLLPSGPVPPASEASESGTASRTDSRPRAIRASSPSARKATGEPRRRPAAEFSVALLLTRGMAHGPLVTRQYPCAHSQYPAALGVPCRAIQIGTPRSPPRAQAHRPSIPLKRDSWGLPGPHSSEQACRSPAPVRADMSIYHRANLVECHCEVGRGAISTQRCTSASHQNGRGISRPRWPPGDSAILARAVNSLAGASERHALHV
jgi:hypothetical protein